MALLLCERQQNLLRVVTMVFRTIGIFLLLLRFLTFFKVFFKIQKVVTFYVFLPCFVRFLELCCYLVKRVGNLRQVLRRQVFHSRHAKTPHWNVAQCHNIITSKPIDSRPNLISYCFLFFFSRYARTTRSS